MASTKKQSTSHRRSGHPPFAAVALVVISCCALLTGCDRSANKLVYGTVTVGHEQQTISGRVTFLPVDESAAPVSHARIIDGRYRIDARGGVPPGKYRVQLEAKRKTGRHVDVQVRGETVKTDEYTLVVAPVYASADSPLTVNVSADSEGRIDLKVPSSD